MQIQFKYIHIKHQSLRPSFTKGLSLIEKNSVFLATVFHNSKLSLKHWSIDRNDKHCYLDHWPKHN